MSKGGKKGRLLAIGVFGFLLFWAVVVSQKGIDNMPQEQEVRLQEEQEEVKTPDPILSFSSVNPAQSETLVVSSNQEPLAGWFNGEAFPFFNIEGTWFALVGISAKLAPGGYEIKVAFLNQEITETIEVKKRAFLVTQLVVTPELEKQGYTPTTIAENIALRENTAIQEAMDEVSDFFFTEPFANPLASMRVVGAYGNIRQSGDIQLQHLGLDLDAKTGDNVYAVNDGVVSFAEPLTNYGNTLIINHGVGLYSLYLHLSEFSVSQGEEVERGEVVARSGNTGYSIAPHLHYSMKLRGASIDPSLFCDTVNREVFGLSGCRQAR